MFVPRAVNRKPAAKPVKPKLPPVKKSECPGSSGTQSQPDPQSDQVTTGGRGSVPHEQAKSADQRLGEPVSAVPSSKKGVCEDHSKDEEVSLCQIVQDGSGSPVAELEGTSTVLETSKPLGDSPRRAAVDATQSETQEGEGSECPARDPGTGVRSGIGSVLPLDIAEIRRSVDKIKRDGKLQAAFRDTREDAAQDTTEAKNEDEDLGALGLGWSVDKIKGDRKLQAASADTREDLSQDMKEAEKEDENLEDHDQDEVVSYSKNQRWPIGEEEPVCVVCGRYGAYICDQTEADVCSRECKARNLARLGLTAGLKKCSTEEDTQPETSNVDTSGMDNLVGYVYKEHEEVSGLSSEQVQEIRAQVDIFVEGVDVSRPILEFTYLAAPKKMESNLVSVGYNVPTPVQMQVIPAALRWRDMMVCAQTSSGKTAAFLVPTILQIYNIMCFTTKEGDGPLGLILSPSRELAMQIEEQAKQLMQGLPNMRTALVVGGVPLPTQLHRLKQDVQLVIATPGRILDVIGRQGISLAAIKTVIIDEVDTMLHKGFQQQVMEVIGHLPDSYQTMLFSATIPPSIEKLASTLLHDPLYISVGKPNTPCTSVRQIVMWVEEPAKKKNLFAILQDPKHYKPPLVVFVDSKIGAGLLSLTIHKMCDIHAASLHGDRPQSERTETLRAFREGEYPVLVCTAVLGRGIDLPGVKMVVNFDMPNTVEEYIHQIGRTGRLGRKGTAITFINNSSKTSNLFLEFVNTLRPLSVPLPPQLTNSAHLRYQQLGHQSWQEARHKRKEERNEQNQDAGCYGNTSYFGYKRRKQETSAVGEILKKRKHKHKKGPR